MSLENQLSDEEQREFRLASEDGKPAVIRGVAIDLRYDGLNWADWESSGFEDEFGDNTTPELTFPWEHSPSTSTAGSTRLTSGDRVSVDRLEYLQRSSPWGELDHLHDRMHLAAYLKVEFATGGAVYPERPLRLWGEGKVWSWLEITDWDSVYRSLETRVAKALGEFLWTMLLAPYRLRRSINWSPKSPRSWGLPYGRFGRAIRKQICRTFGLLPAHLAF